MNKLIYLCWLLFITVSASAQDRFTVQGSMKDSRFEGKNIFLFYGKEKLQAKVQNGRFAFSGLIDQPAYVSLSVDQDSVFKITLQDNDTSRLLMPGSLMLFLEKGNIKVEGRNFKDAVATGTSLNDSYLKFEDQVSKTISKRKLNSPATAKNLADSLRLVYVESNPTSFITVPMLLELNSTYFVSNYIDRLEAVYHRLSPAVKQRCGNNLLHKITAIRNFGVGTKAPDFSIMSDKGKPISLSDYRGKYVLLEFWAHYCVPCIKEVPFLKEAHDLYKDKNFSILQVSVDRVKDKEKWLAAVEKHSSAWDNAIDNEDLTKAAKTAYQVQGIPANFLIDPQGKIIAVDLKGDNLKNTLKSLLN